LEGTFKLKSAMAALIENINIQNVPDKRKYPKDNPAAVKDNPAAVKDNLAAVKDNPAAVKDNPAAVKQLNDARKDKADI
jgi:hypothetical protein